MEQSPFPDWLEQTLIADEAFAAAYATVDAAHRAELKLAVARLAACFGEVPAAAEDAMRSMRQGFHLRETKQRADFACILWDEESAGPTRLLAALMPAVLAGVPHILACRVHGGRASAFPAPVLAALELAGQELTADCGMDALRDLAEHLGGLRRQGRTGRIVALGQNRFTADVAAMALEASIPARLCPGRVCIGIDGNSLPPAYAAHPYGKLAFAHPDAFFVPADDMEAGELSAVFCAFDAAQSWLARCPLVLTPGHESCWLWPDITPDFFMNRGFALCP